MLKIPCVILCGGKSSRMGRDKASLPILGKPLAVFVYQKLSAFFSEVYLSLKDPTPFASHGVRTLCEQGEIYAPMIGLREGLERVGGERVFFLSVDTPFITFEVIARLLEVRMEGVVYAKDVQKEHFLCGVYSKSVLPILEEKIKKQDFKMSSFVHSIPHQSVLFEDSSIFENLNTPEQYTQALQRLEKNG